jgi:hypothetical protein
MPLHDEIDSDGVRMRRERAVAAAVAAGRALGLTVSEAQVLYDVFSVIVHLCPAPVVARVLALPTTAVARLIGPFVCSVTPRVRS